MQCSGQGFRRHLHDTRERTIDDHDDEEPGENQSCQRSGHHGLSTKIVSRKKECEPHGDDGAAKQDKPHNARNDAARHHEPGSARLGHCIQLTQSLGEKCCAPRVGGTKGQRCRIGSVESLGGRRTGLSPRHCRPILCNRGAEICADGGAELATCFPFYTA
jgi:hypothetical protein